MNLRNLFFATAILFAFSIVAFSQNAVTNYSGMWKADLSKSELPEMMKSVEEISMTVKQDEKTISVETAMKGGQGQGPRREPQAMTYTLDGKETSAEVGGGSFAGTATLKAVLSAGDLKLTSIRKGNSPMGEFTMTTNETWKLSDDGKTLAVDQERETPHGTMTAKIIFVKLVPKRRALESEIVMPAQEAQVAQVAPDAQTNTASSTNSVRAIPEFGKVTQGSGTQPASRKRVSGGVLNGKAISLPLPHYPEAARAIGASGQVVVQVTIDVNGNVASATAVSGHPLLQQSAVQAARRAKFSPTILQGEPVVVNGVLIYNFVTPPKKDE